MNCIAIFFCIKSAFAQPGGKSSFQFLHVPSSARLAGLGGVNVSHADRDLSFVFSNPALAGDTLSGFASVNYQFFVGNIGHAAIAYAADVKGIGMLTFGVQHLDYGKIDGYDATGTATGEFVNHESALVVSKNLEQGNFRFGATIKGIFSNLSGYRASAVGVDLGGVFIHPQEDFTIGLAIKNFGIITSEYSSTSKTHLPFDVQLGTTFKPTHMPLRFSLTVFNLAMADVAYDDPTVDDDNVSGVNKVLSHVNVASEILLSRNVNILLGYNFLNHQALKLNTGGGGAGLSFGFSATIKTVDFVFSRLGYVAGSAAYSFSLSSNINKLLKRQ